MVEAVRGRADTVLVVNDLPADAAAQRAKQLGFDVLQLHGPAYGQRDFEAALAIVPRVWRATSLDQDPPLEVGAWGEERLLLDAPKPGSGERWDLTPLAEVGVRGQWLVAGGLTPANVAEVVATVHPWGVDVSSGVESSPGQKSAALIREFIANARG